MGPNTHLRQFSRVTSPGRLRAQRVRTLASAQMAADDYVNELADLLIQVPYLTSSRAGDATPSSAC